MYKRTHTSYSRRYMVGVQLGGGCTGGGLPG